VQAVILDEMRIYVVGGYGPVEPSDGRQGFAQHLRVDAALGDHPTVDRDHRHPPVVQGVQLVVGVDVA
jgi:hypothetical protein